jgi:hypothetical protein
MPDSVESSPPALGLTYVAIPAAPPKNRTAQFAFILGLISVPCAVLLVLTTVFGIELLSLLFLLLWIGCALAALCMGVLGLRNTRKPGTRGRDHAWVAIILGGVTFLLILALLAFAIHSSDSMLNDPHAFGG